MNTKFELTTEEIEFFKENGFVGPFTLYEEEEAIKKWARAKIEMVVSENKPHNSSVLNYDRHLDCETLSEHIMRPEIVGRVQSLLGNDVICWKTNVFPKYPGDSGTGWHQAETFKAGQFIDEPKASLNFEKSSTEDVVTTEITVWTAFSAAKKENGCMRFIRGSHKSWYYDESMPLKPAVESKKHDFFGYDFSESKLDPSWDPDQQDICEMEMKAGQFIFFSSKCVHGSLPNVSDEMRIAFANRYVPPSVLVYNDVDQLNEYEEVIDLKYHGCVLVAGEDKFKHNKMATVNLNGVPFKKQL